MTKRRAGFTLVELVIVIVVIGILAAVAIVQYVASVERGRTSEARLLLQQIRSAQKNHKIDYGEYATLMEQLDVEAPESCTGTHYYRYSVNATEAIATASRCTSGGKSPDYSREYNITINYTTGLYTGLSAI